MCVWVCAYLQGQQECDHEQGGGQGVFLFLLILFSCIQLERSSSCLFFVRKVGKVSGQWAASTCGSPEIYRLSRGQRSQISQAHFCPFNCFNKEERLEENLWKLLWQSARIIQLPTPCYDRLHQTSTKISTCGLLSSLLSSQWPKLGLFQALPLISLTCITVDPHFIKISYFKSTSKPTFKIVTKVGTIWSSSNNFINIHHRWSSFHYNDLLWSRLWSRLWSLLSSQWPKLGLFQALPLISLTCITVDPHFIKIIYFKSTLKSTLKPTFKSVTKVGTIWSSSTNFIDIYHRWCSFHCNDLL